MDKNLASSLLLNLIQRIDLGQINGFTALERAALAYAQNALADDSMEGPAPAPLSPLPTTPVAPPAVEPVALVPRAALPQVPLDLTAVESSAPSDPDVLLCLDFGTAMSKAFAFVQPAGYIDLNLGQRAGGDGYPRRPPKFPRLWPPQTPPPELIGDRR